jgi:hypothetical protein
MYKAREGQYSKNLIPVTESVYHIPERLKEIDNKYFVMFNTKKQRFEIHHAGQPFQSFCLAVPFEELDARIIEYVKQTRRENQKKLIAEMDAHNAKLEADKQRKMQDEVGYYAGELYDWENRHSAVNTLEHALEKR